MNLDEDLLERVKTDVPWAYRSWEPETPAVVLGRGNALEREVYEEHCRHDHVPILRRRGGGGTVVLMPGMLVLSLVKKVQQPYQSQEYFYQINTDIIDALETLDIRGLNQQGHSDICLEERKILGSSMYRSKEILFYTASLMITNELTCLDRYLRHPSQEPAYRRGRSHREFVTTITSQYPGLTFGKVKQALDTLLPARIPMIE